MASLTIVASGTSAVAGVAANSNRTGIIIENSDANRLYALLGENGTASATNYSFSLAQNENAHWGDGRAREKITLIWAGDGSGSAFITELE